MADINFLKRGTAISGGLSKASNAQFLFSALTIMVIIAIVGIYAVMGWLMFYYNGQTKQLGELAIQRKELEEKLGPEQVNVLVSTNLLLANLKFKLQEHVYASELFNLLEKNIHSGAYLANMDFSYSARRVSFDLSVPSYIIFAEQIRLLQDLPVIEKIDFEIPKVESEGITFKLTMYLKPELFKHVN